MVLSTKKSKGISSVSGIKFKKLFLFIYKYAVNIHIDTIICLTPPTHVLSTHINPICVIKSVS